MHNLTVQIVRFVDDYFPGVVACEFVDAAGHRHTFIEKVPIVTAEMCDATTVYPKLGTARCEILERWKDSDERELARVSTASPDAIESMEGLSEFIVLADLLRPVPD